jgi:hypothetical protein
MMPKLKGFFVLFCSLLAFACVSISESKAKYRVTLDASISNSYIQSAWLSYIAPIRGDMDKFYSENPEGEYTVPYNIEVDARNSMADFYLRVQKENNLEKIFGVAFINDQYIEDLIKIRSSNKLNEYVFFSFNPGNWINDKNFNEEEYNNWMENNMPAHIPLTLAYIEKID